MYSEAQLKQALSDTRSELQSLFGDNLSQVLLYGSYARGDQDDESDIDVMALVDLPDTQLAKYRRRVSELSSDIDLRYDVFLSIVLQDTDTFRRYANTIPFFQNVNREGIKVG